MRGETDTKVLNYQGMDERSIMALLSQAIDGPNETNLTYNETYGPHDLNTSYLQVYRIPSHETPSTKHGSRPVRSQLPISYHNFSSGEDQTIKMIAYYCM